MNEQQLIEQLRVVSLQRAALLAAVTNIMKFHEQNKTTTEMADMVSEIVLSFGDSNITLRDNIEIRTVESIHNFYVRLRDGNRNFFLDSLLNTNLN